MFLLINFQNRLSRSWLFAIQFGLVFIFVFELFVGIHAQNPPNQILPVKAQELVIEDFKDGDVFGVNKTVVVKGSVTKGVMAFGGDVVIEGRVEGDVATIGGSVLQKQNSYIGGDVIVLGGGYHHGKTAPLRNPESQTIIYAGYEEELREIAQNPTLLVAPQFSAAYLAQRVLAALFWFVVSLGFLTVSPGAVGRAITRLNLNRLQIVLIGILSFVTGTIGVALGLRFLPSTIGVALGLMTIIALFLAYIFGRVCVHAATGKFLQKLLWRDSLRRSDSVALLLGTGLWTVILSIPFLWSGAFVGLFVVSLGVFLTALFGRNQGFAVKKR